ncbi:MAG: LacI family DNA-binding transcriptional regulator, partial [Bacteroidota bacterium]
MKKRITIKDIARKAGVSIGTVDRVIHNRGEVATKTKELVLRIASEGNYTTNAYARNLKLNKTYRVALLIPNDNEYWESHYQGFLEAVKDYQSLGIQLLNFSFDRRIPDAFGKCIASVLEDQPDAVVLAPLQEDLTQDFCEKLESKSIPYVFVDSNLEGLSPLTFVGQDAKKSGELAAKLLHLTVAEAAPVYILRLDSHDGINRIIEDRIAGFRHFFDVSLPAGPRQITTLTVDFDKVGYLDSLKQVISNERQVGLFAPHSRASEILQELSATDSSNSIGIVGYDLTAQNKAFLQSGLL